MNRQRPETPRYVPRGSACAAKATAHVERSSLCTVEIVPNDNWKEREDKFGRVHTSTRRTWLLVINGEVTGEYRTKREAKSAVPQPEGRR